MLRVELVKNVSPSETNEAQLVSILYNGRNPPPGIVCSPKVQLTLVIVKNIMDNLIYRVFR